MHPSALIGSSGQLAADGIAPEDDQQSNQQLLLRELHARATAQAARAVGLSPAAAIAAAGVPLLPTINNGQTVEHQFQPQAQMPGSGEAVQPANLPAGTAIMPVTTAMVGQPPAQADASESDFTCTVCRKVFKREMNLVFHMTTHRPKQPKVEGEEGALEPVTCQDCGKTFGTKYQAKKHYLRRHFRGERPFGCTKCGKRFVVREDLTMHVKSCGNVYACSCGIRLCSLGALKRHCRHFTHEPASLDPQIHMSSGLLGHSMVQQQPAPPRGPIDQLAYGQLASQFGPRGAASMLLSRQGHAAQGMPHVPGMPNAAVSAALAGMGSFPPADAFGFNCLSAAVHQQPMSAQHAAMLGHASAVHQQPPPGQPQQPTAPCALNLMAGAVASRCADGQMAPSMSAMDLLTRSADAAAAAPDHSSVGVAHAMDLVSQACAPCGYSPAATPAHLAAAGCSGLGIVSAAMDEEEGEEEEGEDEGQEE